VVDLPIVPDYPPFRPRRLFTVFGGPGRVVHTSWAPAATSATWLPGLSIARKPFGGRRSQVSVSARQDLRTARRTAGTDWRAACRCRRGAGAGAAGVLAEAGVAGVAWLPVLPGGPLHPLVVPCTL
jgi:hypothetical protein